MSEEEMRLHRCCFSGHRMEKLRCTEAAVKGWLEERIDEAIEDGFVTFLCGMGMGVDIWAGECVQRKKSAGKDIRLICVTPYPGFSARWSDPWKKAYAELWQAADHRVMIEKSFAPDLFARRNRYLVDHSSRLIVCYSGESGGTGDTVQYALSQGLDVYEWIPGKEE
ncbi:MAG: DUF1273 family protein [Clostridia bacterium]|nr:DUF1273 family protein [Clostridia bacterium]